ncbi:MAG: hypothetical protein V3V65_03390, partial [Hyphomicrobium sp.]
MKIFYDFNSQEIFCDRSHQQTARMGQPWRNGIECGTNVFRAALARGLSPRLRIVLVALKRLAVPRVIS